MPIAVDTKWTVFQNGKCIFPGYKYENGKSTYRGVEVGEGGLVIATPGIYTNVWTFDVTSMHPSSVIAENLFGDEYTKKFKALVEIRKAIKHKDLDLVKSLFNDVMPGVDTDKYLSDMGQAKALAGALKIAINSVYGLTAAKFENPFRHPDNEDNIVAKRGALFMLNLMNEVTARGFKVIHIKTDSIKIQNPTPEIVQFVNDYGNLYGYGFEIEHKFEKICLVNDAVYIAKLSTEDEEWIDECKKAAAEGLPEPTRWTATGTQFAVPYVFKTLFSGEPIEFKDMCETKSVSKGDLYLDFNEGLPDVSEMEAVLEAHRKKVANRKMTKKEEMMVENYPDLDEVNDIISTGHKYIFIGRVSSFCPIKPDKGGGLLYRYSDSRYNFAPGCKGYRWMEAEEVKTLGKEEDIDKSYYMQLVNDAIDKINTFIPDSEFVSVDHFRE